MTTDDDDDDDDIKNWNCIRY